MGKEALAEEFDKVEVKGVRVVGCKVAEKVSFGSNVLECFEEVVEAGYKLREGKCIT